jgi:hypothetical protein
MARTCSKTLKGKDLSPWRRGDACRPSFGERINEAGIVPISITSLWRIGTEKKCLIQSFFNHCLTLRLCVSAVKEVLNGS